jgi:hypothetical protein
MIDLVDSLEYVTTNCFQHQLTRMMKQVPGVSIVTLADLANHIKDHDRIVCRLKQRTLDANLDSIARLISDMQFTAYDQDPWNAFTDDSPYKGVYFRAMQRLNVKHFDVTSKWWADMMMARGIPSRFVPMWMLPEYCDEGMPYVNRPISVGFVGGVHKHRRELFDRLRVAGINVLVPTGSLSHGDYLRAISCIKIFIRSEDVPATIDGMPINLQHGLWGRDVEVASRGCFSIRIAGQGSEAYFAGFPIHDGKSVVRQYEREEDIPRIINDIETMEQAARQDLIHATVDYIRRADRWQETARMLTSFGEA